MTASARDAAGTSGRSEGRQRPGDLPAERSIADFDSATALVRSTARALRGEPVVPPGHDRLRGLAVSLSGLLPRALRRGVRAGIAAADGVPPHRLGQVDMEAVAGWFARHYEGADFPGLVIGSTNGALGHLCAATGMPFLPQTMLVPVRWSDNDPDDAFAAMEFGRQHAPALLERNPGVWLNHMHDANQDRLLVGRTAFFRTKWTVLPSAYEEFIRTRLAPGAPLVIFEDASAWPVTVVGERHVFQVGAHGGLSAEDYLDGSSRVAQFLRTQGSNRSRIAAPEPTRHATEAEWGYDQALTEPILKVAEETGHPVLSLRIPWPQVLSGPVASMVRRRLRGAGLPGDQLLVESYVMQDPVQALRTGSVPYWTFFGVQPGRHAALHYVADAAAADDPFATVRVMLYPHGVESVGGASPADWRTLAEYVDGSVSLMPGIEQRWPTHFDTLPRFGQWLRSLPTVVDSPLPLLPVEEALESIAIGEIELTRLSE